MNEDDKMRAFLQREAITGRIGVREGLKGQSFLNSADLLHARIAFLEEQLVEKDKIIDEYRNLIKLNRLIKAEILGPSIKGEKDA